MLAFIPAIVMAQPIQDSLTTDLNKLFADTEIIGFSVAIVNSKEVLYSKAFGWADKKNNQPYTTQAVQPIASISKTLIGIALLKAQELDLLKLDDNIHKYLPFKIVNPHFPEEVITIRHLSNHTASLNDSKHYEKSYVFEEEIPPIYEDESNRELRKYYKKLISLYNQNKYIPLTEFLNRIYLPEGEWYSQKNFLKTKPGVAFEYSNNGAALASIIIEQVSGMPYVDFIKKYILDPLDMKDSGWDLSDYPASQKSKLYPLGKEVPNYKLITLADGGFVTNVQDFSIYLQALINGYLGEDNIISSSSYSKMMKEKINHHQGVFWETRLADNPNLIGHSGGDPGVNTIAFIDKRNNIGYIYFSNTSDTDSMNNFIIKLMEYAPGLAGQN